MTFWTVVWAVVVGNVLWRALRVGISLARDVVVVMRTNKYKDVS